MFPKSDVIYSAVGNVLHIFLLNKVLPSYAGPITLVEYFMSLTLMNFPANKDT
jgi:hypothetical protein